MTNLFVSNYKIMFGSDDEAKTYILDMSKDERIKYLQQCLNCLTFLRPQFANYDTTAVATKIVETYSDEEYFELTKDLFKFLYFNSSKNATDQFVEALTKIMSHASKKEKRSLKNVYVERYPDYKNEVQDMISASITQTYKMVSNHMFLLLQQLFTKLCNETNFVSDERFVKIADMIRKSTGKLQDATNGNIVRIIRNGIAHMSFLDNSTTIDCKDIDALNKNIKVKISSKDGSEFVVIEGQYVNMLMVVMCDYLSEVMSTYNIPKEYFYVKDEHKRKLMLEKYGELLNNPNTQDYEKEFINLFMETDINAALNCYGYARVKTAIEYPQVMYLEDLVKLRDKLTELNSSRNKTVNDIEGIYRIMPVLGLTYLFNAVSNLVDLKLTKDFVNDNYESDWFKEIRLFKMDTNPKKKSVINKFRLLRNCLAHSYVLKGIGEKQLFDVDENGEKINLGKINEGEIFELCDRIESYIMQHYFNKLEEIRIDKPEKTQEVM